MKKFVKSHSSKGRIKAITKNASIDSWHTLFDQEITNAITQHPFVDQFTWIKPDCESNYQEELPLQQISLPNFYLFENIFPNSILSIPFIQKSVINNNGAFISLPDLPVDSNCTLSTFYKQAKVAQNEVFSELLAIVKTPNSLFKNVIIIDRFMKQPPHMRKSNHFSFHKIELSDKSYWNDKTEKGNDLPDNLQGISFNNVHFDSTFNQELNIHTEVDTSFFNPLLNNCKNIVRPNNYKSNIYICIYCMGGNEILRDNCYCNAIKKSKNPPTEPYCRGFSYYTKGSGNNPFYLSIQRQFNASFFTKADFLCYFDKDDLLNLESEEGLIKSLETILCLNGSPNAKITPIGVKLVTEQINKQLIEGIGCSSRCINIIFGSNDTSREYFSDMLLFIDLNIITSLLNCSSSIKISNTQILEQIIEYFDILIHQNLFSEHQKLINPFHTWDLRFDQFINKDLFDIPKESNLLSLVPTKEAPNKIIKIAGLLRPTIIHRLVWYAANQVATGIYSWSLIHLKGIENSPVSFNFKAHFNDENKNSVNDLYLLIFRINNEINILCLTVTNHNDANL